MALLTWILTNFWALLLLLCSSCWSGCASPGAFRKYGATREEFSYILRRSPFYFVVLVFCFFAVSPFLIMFLHTFKTDGDLYRRPQPFIFRQEPTIEHLDALFNNTAYLDFIRNSILVGVAVVIITLVLSLAGRLRIWRA